MTAIASRELRRKLRGLGLSNDAITAAWPRWWSTSAEDSASARTELAFTLARRFGLDARSLLEAADQPRFLWSEEARFKHLSGESDLERAGLTSFGRAVGAALLAATTQERRIRIENDPTALRASLIRTDHPYVDLVDLVLLAWAAGVPVAHVRVYPLRQKRMAAMSVSVGTRPAVLLGRDAVYPAPISFYLAHELGHVVLGHVPGDRLLIDFEQGADPKLDQTDDEERAADEFALVLLTGRSRPTVLPLTGRRPSARSLASAALENSAQLGIDPGVLAGGYGFSTDDWPVANKALGYIYAQAQPVWQTINAIARRELDWSLLPDDTVEFVETVLGKVPAAG